MTINPEEIRMMLKKGQIIPAHVIEQLLYYYESHPYKCVKEFHETFGLTINETPTFTENQGAYKSDRELRVKLENEEHKEYLEAEEADDIVEVFDALLDKVYVSYGTAITYGLPMLSGMAEVQRSNMSKLFDDGPRKTDWGKVLKGPNFSEPNLETLLRCNGYKE